MTKDTPHSVNPDSLSTMSVVQLRDVCRNLKLHVSGKKSVLIDRILNAIGDESKLPDKDSEEALLLEDEEITPSTNYVGDAVDKLISKVESLGDHTVPPRIDISTNLLEDKPIILEAELFVAEKVEETKKEVKTKTIILNNDSKEDDAASLVITIPTLTNIKLNPKMAGAVFAVLLLIGGTVFFVLNNDNSFTSQPLHHGDTMNFNVNDAHISVIGDDMVQIFRDASGDVLEDICGELEIIMHGDGSVSVANEEQPSTDSLGRSGFLTVEKRINHNLIVDFEGKTWRDTNDCGNLGVSLAGNLLDMSTTSWVELESEELKRTNTNIHFTSIDNQVTNMQAVTYGLEGVGNLDALIPILTLPLKPIELHSFFGGRTLFEGSTSFNDPTWNSDWQWTVGKEYRDKTHGLVYPITMHHVEIGKCIGSANIEIQVKEGNPWPIYQKVDILIDKSSSNSDCNFIVSSAADSLLPDGRLNIRLTMGESSSALGTKNIDWGKNYIKPETGDDRPRTSDKRKWSNSMWDESEIRIFNLEESKNCLEATHAESDAAKALIKGGYIWQAYWQFPENSINPQWNLSWVDPDDESGWILLTGNNSDDCTIVDSGSNLRDEIKWNNEAIPETPSMYLLEQRVLSIDRYPDLHNIISNSQDYWESDISFGYRLSVSEGSGILSIIPINLGVGTVSLTASRTWSDSGKDNTATFAMNAATGEMLSWYHIES